MTSKPSPCAAYDVKRWANRLEEVQQHGITIFPTQTEGPYFDDAIVLAEKYLRGSFQTDTEFTK